MTVFVVFYQYHNSYANGTIDHVIGVSVTQNGAEKIKKDHEASLKENQKKMQEYLVWKGMSDANYSDAHMPEELNEGLMCDMDSEYYQSQGYRVQSIVLTK